MHINIKMYWIYVTVIAIIILLLTLNIVQIISVYGYGIEEVFGGKQLEIKIKLDFDFNTEMNMPSHFSALSLLFSSLLLGILAAFKKKMRSDYVYWLGLTFIFLFLSIDELFSIHERFDLPMRNSLSTSGLLYFAWFIPYSVVLLLLAVPYYRFVRRLPKQTRNLFILSGVLFVSGAIGFEMFEGYIYEFQGENLSIAILCTVEELLEMSGTWLFIYALLEYIKREITSFTITIK